MLQNIKTAFDEETTDGLINKLREVITGLEAGALRGKDWRVITRHKNCIICGRRLTAKKTGKFCSRWCWHEYQKKPIEEKRRLLYRAVESD